MKITKKVLFISVLILLFTNSFCYALTWNWSFGTESGTFITDGTSYSPGTYNVLDFSVISTGSGASIGSWLGGQYAANGYDTTTPYAFDYNGSAITKWDSAGINSFDWLVFDDLANDYYYFFGWETGNINTVDQATYYNSAGSIFESYALTVSPGSQSIPEASSMLLLGCGLVGLWGVRRKFKK